MSSEAEDTTVARRTSLRPSELGITPSLVVLSGLTMGRAYPLESKNLIIGRADDADIIVEDESVSRHHAKIVILPHGHFMVKDLGSESGTLVNRAPVEAHPLRDGDQIQVGNITLKFAMEDTVEIALRDRLFSAAMRDPLTKLYNRRAFDEHMVHAMALARRHQNPFGLVLLDLDHFKTINDRFGHPVGDAVLKELAEVLSRAVRTEDFLARLGGEEFVVVCAGAGRAEATSLGLRLLEAVRRHVFRIERNLLRLTVSAGVSEFDPRAPLTTNEVLAEADALLYRAKRTGRDRLCAGTLREAPRS